MAWGLCDVKSDAKSAMAKAVPTSDEFTRTLGQVTWLMTLSPTHRKQPIEQIEAHVSAPLMFKQVRVFLKDKQPLAAIIWASVSLEVKARIDAGGYVMRLEDWRSGTDVVIVDCVSPLVDAAPFREAFLGEVEKAQAARET